VVALPELADLGARIGTSTLEVPDTVSESEDALILYTSGTHRQTQRPLLDHHRVMWANVIFVATCGMRVGDRFLHVAPLYQAAELCVMLMPGTMIGATHGVLPGFDAGKFLDALESERITMSFGVPTMFQLLLRQPDVTRRDLSTWLTGLFGRPPPCRQPLSSSSG
jgi:acyl-CoA synthetase (AMP-forming)/AMP-acid ligase II